MRRPWIPQVIAIIMLLWALNLVNPYDYYVTLHWVCCGIFAYLAIQSLEHKKQGWVWVFGIMALFYNPIFPPFPLEYMDYLADRYITNSEWSIVYVVTIGIAVASIFTLGTYKVKKEKNNTP
jgi:hypothetical protein